MAEVQKHGFEFQERVRDRSGWKKGIQISQFDSFDLPMNEAPTPFPFPFDKCNGHSKTHVSDSIHLADAKKYIIQSEPYYMVLGSIKQSSPKYKIINEITILYISTVNHKRICGDMTSDYVSEIRQIVKWGKFPLGMVEQCRTEYKQWIINHPINSYIKMNYPSLKERVSRRNSDVPATHFEE